MPGALDKRLGDARRQLTACSGPAVLLDLVVAWSSLVGTIRQVEGKSVSMASLRAVAPPFSKPLWTPRPLVTDGRAPFALATFGWWELQPPSHELLAALCQLLRDHNVGVCCVTSLPTRGFEGSLNGVLGYSWYDEWRSDVESVGFLARTGLDPPPRVIQLEPTHPAREKCILVAGILAHGVYGPWVGKWNTEIHKGFLRKVLDNHWDLVDLAVGAVWTAGDFNIRGAAPGRSALPATRLGQELAFWFKFEVKQRGLRILHTAATHKAKGALDIHILDGDSNAVPGIFWTPFSDHALTVLPNTLTSDLVRAWTDKACTPVEWCRDPARKSKALSAWQAHAGQLAKAIDGVACEAVRHFPSSAVRCSIADASSALLHAIFVMCGHAAGLTVVGSPSVVSVNHRGCAREVLRDQGAALLLSRPSRNVLPTRPQNLPWQRRSAGFLRLHAH